MSKITYGLLSKPDHRKLSNPIITPDIVRDLNVLYNCLLIEMEIGTRLKSYGRLVNCTFTIQQLIQLASDLNIELKDSVSYQNIVLTDTIHIELMMDLVGNLSGLFSNTQLIGFLQLSKYAECNTLT